MKASRPKFLVVVAWCILGALAAVSFGEAIRNALRGSTDVQWWGAQLLIHHVDPYRAFLEPDPHHLLLMNQVPNYLHVLYVLLLPVGCLSFATAKIVWVVLNACFAVVTISLLALTYRLQTSQAVLLGLLLLTSTPFRIVVGTGQQSLLELVLLSIALWAPTRAGWALGLSYFKYSFSPIIVFYALWRGAWKQLGISLLVIFASLIAFWSLAGGRFSTVALEPFRVSHVGVSIADADLVSLVRVVHPAWQTYAVAAGITLSALLSWIIVRVQHSLESAAAALITASLAMLPHGTYDYVVLTIPAALLLSTPRWNARTGVGLACIATLWYAFKVIPMAGATLLSIFLHLALVTGVFVSVLDWPKRDLQLDESLVERYAG